MPDFITQFAADEGVSRDNFNSRISEANTALTTVEGKANAAQSTANTAVSNAAAAKTLAEAALPKTGGIMTGAIQFNTGNGYTAAPVQLYGGDSNGAMLKIQGGGMTVIGSGEAPDNLINAEGMQGQSEFMHICSDQAISLWTACQTIANRKKVEITTTGALIVPDHTDYTTAKTRNIRAGTGGMTAGSTNLNNGEIYLQYE